MRNRQIILADSPVVLGLDFGGTKIAMAVCDLTGNQLASATVSTLATPGSLPSGSEPSARGIFNRGIETAHDLLASTAPGRELAAVGAATFGIPFEDRVELAPAIEGWESLALGRELRAAFEGADVRMATDAKAAAAAEVRWGALNDSDPGVYLNLGTGLAAAIVIGGKVVSGANGAAGEIGYNLRAISDVGLALDRRVPLEGMVSGLGLARQADSTGLTSPASPADPAGRPMTAADIFEASPADPALDDLLASFVAELAFHLVNLAICLNPVRISVGGGMVRSWERLRPLLEHALSAAVPFPPELVVARFPYDAPLLGAVALAVDAASGREKQVRGIISHGASNRQDQGADGVSVPIRQDMSYRDTMIQDTMA
jgi:glucokinase